MLVALQWLRALLAITQRKRTCVGTSVCGNAGPSQSVRLLQMQRGPDRLSGALSIKSTVQPPELRGWVSSPRGCIPGRKAPVSNAALPHSLPALETPVCSIGMGGTPCRAQLGRGASLPTSPWGFLSPLDHFTTQKRISHWRGLHLQSVQLRPFFPLQEQKN